MAATHHIQHSTGQLLAQLQLYFTKRHNQPSLKRHQIRQLRRCGQHRSILGSTSLYNDEAANTPSSSAGIVERADGVGPKTELAANIIKPKPLFPWRHSPHPLPRLVPLSVNNATYNESEYYRRGGHLGPGWPRPMPSWFRTACQANSMRLLGVPYWKMLLPWVRKKWIYDMEDSFCDAFGRAVSGMILDTYSLEGELVDRSHHIM